MLIQRHHQFINSRFYLLRFLVLGVVICLFMIVGLVSSNQALAMTLTNYQSSLDKYREAYSDFEVKRGFYNQTQTFAAEESLVDAARLLLITRNRVWTDYFSYQIKQLSVKELEGNALALNQIGPLTNQVEWLTSESKSYEPLSTRTPLLAAAANVNTLKDTYDRLAYQTNVIMVFGRMQYTAKQLIQFNQALQQRVESQDIVQVDKQTKLRGLTVALERLEALQTSIEINRAELLDRMAYSGSEVYPQLVESTQSLYGELMRINQIHEELADGVLW